MVNLRALLLLAATGCTWSLPAVPCQTSEQCPNQMVCVPGTKVCAHGWHAVASMPQASVVRATTSNGRLYVAYGSYFAVYDPAVDTWSTLPSDPAAPTVSGGQGLGLEALGGVIYGIGGVAEASALNTASAYAPGANAWTAIAPILNARYDFASGAWNGHLYIAGGTNQSAGLRPVEEYDPTTNQWTAGPDMPLPTQAPMGAVVNGVFYVAGGFYAGAPSAFRAYDIASKTWSQRASLPTPRYYGAAVALNSSLYLIGGQSGPGQVLATVDVYDPATDSWSAGPPLSVPRLLPGVAVLDGVIYAAGGNQTDTGNQGAVLSSVEALGL